jgi:Uma2 family endonuclease
MATARHRFTLDEWHQMIEIGVLRKDQRLELLDGEIYEMAPIYPSDQSVVDRLTQLLHMRFGTQAIIRVHGPVPARPRSELQPDVAVLRKRDDFYRAAHPEADAVHLIIEVADAPLDRDHAKLRLYATAGMREVWIVDLGGERVEVYRDPQDTRYADVSVVARGEQVACLAFPDVPLAVDDILG